LITTANITMQFGAKPLFENISVKFGNGNRYGLIGANGCGKSTLMKILGGDQEPTSGNVSVDANERLGKLRQDQFAFENHTVLDTVIMGHAELWRVKQERDRIYGLAEMSEEDGMQVADLEHKFAELDGYTAEARAGELLLGVGIPLLFILWPIAWYLAIRKAPDLLTPKGREVASRWLGVRAFIHGTGSLDDLPPAAVTVWDRYLAYGAAMDLSETAVEGLLMHFRTDMKVSDVMSVGHSIFDPNALGGIITEQMAQMHADKLHDLGFTAAAPFGPDAGDFCVLARSTERGLSAGIPGWGADFPQWAQALARRADALRASAPPEIASAVWAVHDELEPMLTTLSHATSFQVVAPTLQGYQHVMASPTMKQHAEQIATYLRDQCHMIIDMERFNRS